ncbi:helix-turn-helix domain-containing protein [Actinophytocola sp. NPDC049390]|uniref:helix-turn-helix domain-containing protein n=1 Tax=Actinophytocola sp. NPDC049390 TaxID=3363894 RepID=UPI0037878BC7
MGTLVVPNELRPWVVGIDVAAASGADAVDLPDHATTLVVRTTPGERRSVVVMGPRTRAAYHVADPGPSCVRVRLRPGRAQALLGRPVRDLADRVVQVRVLPGLDVDGLVEDPVGALAVAVAERGVGDDLVGEAAELLAEEGVAATARRLHVSERRLRALFADGVGLSPKHFARIDRVRSVLATASGRRWADVAASAGYYDQSHMTSEFRHLMGVPPAAYAAGRRPVARRCG